MRQTSEPHKARPAASRALTRELGHFAATVTFDSLPREFVDRLRLDALDSIAVGVFGHTMPWVRVAADYWKELGGTPQAAIWGQPYKLPVPKAVLSNSHAMNSFEFDDTYLWGNYGTHQGNNVVPAAVATAEAIGRTSGRELLLGLAVGHEIGIRVLKGITRRRLGWNHTAICSTFGAAAAAGKILGLNEHQMTWALGSAGSYVGGLLTMPPHSMVKRLVNGRAAEGGVIGAFLAKRGFTGIENILESRQGGFYSMHAESFDPDSVVEGLGKTYFALNIHTKRFPVCTMIHAPLEATLSLMSQHDFSPREIEKILVRTTTGTLDYTVGFQPETISSAQMSLAFGIATLLKTGSLTHDTIVQASLDDQELRRLMNSVEPVVDPEFEKISKEGPGSVGPAQVEIALKDGQHLVSPVVPEASPMSEGEIEDKARGLIGRVMGSRRADEIVSIFRQLEDTNLEDLFSLLQS